MSTLKDFNRAEQDKSISEYLSKWEITDDLRELCEGLAGASGDDTHRNILESGLSELLNTSLTNAIKRISRRGVQADRRG
jgi:hypothetical protein